MSKFNLTFEQASVLLYNSKVYNDMENIDTGVWKLSPLFLAEQIKDGNNDYPEVAV